MIGLRNRRRLGGLAWGVGVVAAAAWGWQQSAATGGSPGLGYAQIQQIASVTDGRLESLAVDLHEDVGAGAVVATLASEPIQREREMAAAEFLALSTAPLVDPEALIEQARDKARAQQVQTELATVGAQLNILRGLLASGAATQAEIDEVEAKQADLRSKLARQQPDALDAPLSEWTVIAALRSLEEVEARLASHTLRTGVNGRVSAVWRRPGEVVLRGEPILTVEPLVSTEVVAYVLPTLVPAAGAPVSVVRANGTRIVGEVVSVAPGVVVLPEQIWRIPKQAQFGVPVRVRLKEASIRPSEPVQVFL